MIISFGGKNCWCFKDLVEINMSINNNVPKEYGFSDIGILPTMCFIGANASGKTNALRILSFIKEFCLNSFNEKPNSQIAYYPYFMNNDTSTFFINFYIGNDYSKEYRYELITDLKSVHSEIITIKNSKGKKSTLLKRLNNKITINNLINKNTNVILRNNASFISTYNQYGIKEIDVFYDFFSNIVSNVTLYQTINEPEEAEDSKYYYNHKNMLKKVIKEISKYDTGITNINVNKYKVPSEEKDIDIYISMFEHDVENQIKALPIYLQSMGTRTLYSSLPDILSTIDNGGVLIFDEIDCHLHPMITNEIINYFINVKNNEKKAQLIFTTHDQSILDMLKKYCIYVFNKEHGESYCYRVDEIKDKGFIRNDKSLQNIYKQGLLGGLPNVKK